jgi:hypothetical protein
VLVIKISLPLKAGWNIGWDVQPGKKCVPPLGEVGGHRSSSDSAVGTLHVVIKVVKYCETLARRE